MINVKTLSYGFIINYTFIVHQSYHICLNSQQWWKKLLKIFVALDFLLRCNSRFVWLRKYVDNNLKKKQKQKLTHLECLLPSHLFSDSISLTHLWNCILHLIQCVKLVFSLILVVLLCACIMELCFIILLFLF